VSRRLRRVVVCSVPRKREQHRRIVRPRHLAWLALFLLLLIAGSLQLAVGRALRGEPKSSAGLRHPIEQLVDQRQEVLAVR